MLPGRRISPSCCCCHRDRREWSRWTTRDDGYCRHWSKSVPSPRSCWDHVSVFATTTSQRWCGAKRIPRAGCQRPVQPPNTIVFINLHGRGGHHSLLALSIVIGSRSQIGDLGLVIVLLSMDVEWISNRFVVLKTADRVTITWTERIINRKLSQPICLS